MRQATLESDSSLKTEALFIPITGSEEELARATYFATLADPSKVGKRLAKAARQVMGAITVPKHYDLVSASPVNPLSGVNFKTGMFREGSLEPIERWIRKLGGHINGNVRALVRQISERGDQAVVVASEKIVIGVVVLKIVKTY